MKQIELHDIKTFQKKSITNSTVLLRVDFNVALTPKRHIADDARIIQALPTIRPLLQDNNKLIIVSHLDRPKKRDPKCSLSIVAERLQGFLHNYNVCVIDDFQSEKDQARLKLQQPWEVFMLENIRFYEGEQKNDSDFAKQLASLADVYVNDAFGVCHRNDASVVGIPKFIPSYAGLLLAKEIRAISNLMNGAQKPITAIIGGAKISTKIAFLSKLIDLAEYVLLGGGIAHTFLLAQNKHIGNSLVEKDQVQLAQQLLEYAATKKTTILLPVDAVGRDNTSDGKVKVYNMKDIPETFTIYDIGPETQAQYAHVISKSKTIVWNGPVGYCEDEEFTRGTDFLYYTIAHTNDAFSLVGGGDTIAAISKKAYLNKITHISTGGGAMLEFIEKSTLPGIEALRTSSF